MHVLCVDVGISNRASFLAQGLLRGCLSPGVVSYGTLCKKPKSEYLLSQGEWRRLNLSFSKLGARW